METNILGIASPDISKYWGMLKNLDDSAKLELIALLSNSVVYKKTSDLIETNKDKRKKNLMSLAGCWSDEPDDADQIERAIKSVRENDSFRDVKVD